MYDLLDLEGELIDQRFKEYGPGQGSEYVVYFEDVMTAINNLKSEIQKLHLKVCPFAEANSCTPDICVLKAILGIKD